ncbi:hypothetical protein [Candidatus Viadribacter manganicus]|uniref:Uncharacterized protein n=1 Tax=Candidatus Viadribacter manganicus TaxID=1759059 RepID=A0A1B1AEL2_9PROT|nr:hypothetical protein [Candidatus Viadribacter manganicus]ANP44993.1 hypothetical protein ATE48_03175 [Candidatus Viadribacter manganicus]
MNGQIHRTLAAPSSGAASRFSADRGLVAALAAGVIGAVSLLSPPLAILGLALLAARVLLSGEAVRIDWFALLGPAFAAFVVGVFVGLPGAIGTLFVWRLFADTRWSVGEATRLAAAAGRPAETNFKALAHAWMTPLYGLMLVAYTAPHMIAGLPLDLPHVPIWLVIGMGVLAAGAVFDWGLQRAADWRLGELAAAPATHLLTHHILFVAAFGLMIDVTAGVVMLMAWRLAHAAPLRQSFTAVP